MKLAAIIGNPVSHSLSPKLHGWWLKEYGIEGAYVPLKVERDDLEAVLELLPRLGFAGVNITVPHKEAVCSWVEKHGEIDHRAAQIGAVNTVVFQGGKTYGSNTDHTGFITNIHVNAPHWRAEGAVAVILGAGGAARAVLVALIEAGVKEFRLVNRTLAKAEELVARFSSPGIAIRAFEWRACEQAMNEATLLVNTTSLGMKNAEPLRVDLAPLPKTALVTDIVYNPLETELLRVAKTRGNPVLDGLGMLLYQAVPGFEAWFGVKPEVTPALRKYILKSL